MLEQLVLTLGRTVWEDSLHSRMRYYKKSIIIHTLFSIMLAVAALLLLFAFYQWLYSLGMTSYVATLATAAICMISAGILLLAWSAMQNESGEDSMNHDFLEEVITSFISGLQSNTKYQSTDSLETGTEVSNIHHDRRFKN